MFSWKNNDFYRPYISRLEQREIERLFARLFSTEDGKTVMSYLQHITFERVLGANTTDEQLRYAEGQRALLSNISRLIERGRNG